MSKEYLTNKIDFDGHLANKNNPHGVTAAQAGAMPIIEKAHGTDLNHITQTGLYGCLGWINYPPGLLDGQGNVLVITYISSGSSDGWLSQIYFEPHGIKTFERALVDGNWSDWQQLATTSDLANYLPLAGGTLSGFRFGLADYKSFIDGGQDISVNHSPNGGDDNNRTYLRISHTNTLHEAVQLVRVTNGDAFSTNIFGQHNTALLASTIQYMIQTGEVKTLDEATKATLSNIEANVQKSYEEAQQEGADAIILELLERGIL